MVSKPAGRVIIVGWDPLVIHQDELLLHVQVNIRHHILPIWIKDARNSSGIEKGSA
jgi:hypothetical protein